METLFFYRTRTCRLVDMTRPLREIAPMRRASPLFAWCCAAVMSAATGTASAVWSPEFVTHAQRGQVLADASMPVTVGTPSTASIGSEGTIEFRDFSRWYVGTPTQPRVVISGSNPAISHAGHRFTLPFSTWTQVGEGGVVGFLGTEDITSSQPPSPAPILQDSLWGGTLDADHRVAVQGQSVTGLPAGRTLTNVRGRGDMVMSPSGTVAFTGGTLGTSLTEIGLFVARPEGVTLVARPMGSAEGLGLPGRTILGIGSPSINRAGNVAVVARDNAGSTLISYGAPGAMQILAQTNQPLAGLPVGTRLTQIQSFDLSESAAAWTTRVGLNNAGKVAFRGTLFATGGSPTDAMLTADSSGVRVLAQRGMGAPGAPAGSVFQSFGIGSLPTSVIGGGGHVVFAATAGTSTPFVNGLWIGTRSDDLRSIGIFNAPISGNTNAIFRTSDLVRVHRTMTLNERGQCMFVAGADFGSGENLTTLFAYDPIEGLNPIVYAGATLTVDGSPLIVSSFHVPGMLFNNPDPAGQSGSGNQDGVRTYLNDLGQGVVTVSFTDGSTRVMTFTIPEPHAAAGLALAGMLACRKRRRD